MDTRSRKTERFPAPGKRGGRFVPALSLPEGMGLSPARASFFRAEKIETRGSKWNQEIL